MGKDDLEILFERDLRGQAQLLFKICRIYTTTQADREDLYQEIVLQLWKSYPSFRGDSKFSTWMYRIAINTALSGFRKKTIATEPFHPEQISEASSPADNDDQISELYSAINRLNEIEKAIIVLYLEDKSYDEMEEILGINNGTLRVKMNRIKEKLRQLTNVK